MFFDKGLASFHLCWIERVNFCNLGGEVRMKVDGMVIGAMGGSWSWVFSEKTSVKSSHHLGTMGSTDGVAWVIWVEMVVLLICSPFNQACHLFSLREIFQSASRPNQRRRYCWGR